METQMIITRLNEIREKVKLNPFEKEQLITQALLDIKEINNRNAERYKQLILI